MSLHNLMSTAEVKALFAEEVTAVGGTVSDTFDDGVRLLTRSILPQVREVRTGDGLQGGVALRVTEDDVRVHPYVFRLVCRNGAIVAHAIQTLRVEFGEFFTPEEAANTLRCAIQECAAEEAFASAVEEIRSARHVEADAALTMMPTLARLGAEAGAQFVQIIMQRFTQEGDRTRFGLMNAITSVARDTTDPEMRWRLEELGGGVPACREPHVRHDKTAARKVLAAC